MRMIKRVERGQSAILSRQQVDVTTDEDSRLEAAAA
jgi:hypothetical protein